MENESKIVELLSEMLHKFDALIGTVVNLTGRVDNLTDRVDNLTGRVDNLNVTVDLRLGKVESEIVKLNVTSAENSRALLKMGDYNERIIRLGKSRL
jgi:stress response protein SCP2